MRRTALSPSSSNVGEHLFQADTEVVPAWKQELNERLAATRSRRLRIQGEHIQGEQVALPGLEHLERKVESRASRLAAKVAQR
jgi:phage terminase large subunit-like protein